jgi:hypothetical protein
MRDHYRLRGITAMQVIEEYGFGFVLGNVVKYILRHEHKHDKQDLIKAVWYLAYHITSDLSVADKMADELTQSVGEANERLA